MVMQCGNNNNKSEKSKDRMKSVTLMKLNKQIILDIISLSKWDIHKCKKTKNNVSNNYKNIRKMMNKMNMIQLSTSITNNTKANQAILATKRCKLKKKLSNQSIICNWWMCLKGSKGEKLRRRILL